MVHESLTQSEDFNNNKFYMWRCITAMAHADGIVHQDEKAFLEKIFSNMHQKGQLTEDALNTLKSDLDTPQNISSLLAHIEDPAYRGQVVYFARLLAHADGENSESEELLLKRLYSDTTNDLDIDTITKDIRHNVKQELVVNEVENDAKRPTGLMYKLIDQIALAFNIDLMDP